MGIEAFGVSMHFVEPGVYGHVRKTLESDKNVHLSKEQKLGEFYVGTGEYFDESHVIEFQLSQEAGSDKCSLALRFSLCSYNSIDTIFTKIVEDVLSSAEADVWLMASSLKQKDNYPPGEAMWLIKLLPEEIAAMRNNWQNLFGTKQGVVRVKDSFSFVGLQTRPANLR
jgi:hypothetical protein